MQQVRYLQDDATEALTHMRMALNGAAGNATLDLPAGNATAPDAAITLPGAQRQCHSTPTPHPARGQGRHPSPPHPSACSKQPPNHRMPAPLPGSAEPTDSGRAAATMPLWSAFIDPQAATCWTLIS
jgi:hypothetical protein